jgi:hypothetical protein
LQNVGESRSTVGAEHGDEVDYQPVQRAREPANFFTTMGM